MRLWPLALFVVAGCGGSSAPVVEPPETLTGSFSGTWDAPLIKEYGTVSLTFSGGKATGTGRNTVKGGPVKIVLNEVVRSAPDQWAVTGTWRRATDPIQPFSCQLVELSGGGMQGYCSLDYAEDPYPKKYIVAMTMSLNKD